MNDKKNKKIEELADEIRALTDHGVIAITVDGHRYTHYYGSSDKILHAIYEVVNSIALVYDDNDRAKIASTFIQASLAPVDNKHKPKVKIVNDTDTQS